MAKVKFKFDVDGVYQELKYYRSTTPMDVSSMPAPIKAGFTEKEITDEAAPDSDFYVRFSAIRNGVEYISDEINIDVDLQKLWYETNIVMDILEVSGDSYHTYEGGI